MPKFQNESAFEIHLRELIASEVSEPEFSVLDYKTVADIIICRNGVKPGIFFIEVKYFQLSKGRLGFGNIVGEGIQPEILVKRPAYLESNLRWLLGSNLHGDGAYWFVASEVLRQYVAGGSIGKKQNNIQEALFRNISPKNEEKIKFEIGDWLRNN